MVNDMTHYNEVKVCRTNVHQWRTLLMLLLVLGGGEAMAQVRIHGSVFGGGNNADVENTTSVNISTGEVQGNVYGGGNLGDVGKIVKNTTNYNYKWTNEPNTETQTYPYYNYNNTGICNVEITGGTIGTSNSMNDEGSFTNGNVFGGGKGEESSFYCEKGMVYTTEVKIEAGIVNGNVYGGGQIARVESDTKVTVGPESGTGAPQIKGNVFGAGAGLDTHGYSALVRGNPTVTIQGGAIIGSLDNNTLIEGTGNVYGGGEIASVGKHKVKTSANDNQAPEDLPLGMPYTLDNTDLGKCAVNVQGNAQIKGSVYGAGKGVNPVYDPNNKPRRMGMSDWEIFETEEAYLVFVHTLSLTTETKVTINGASVNGSVYGGSQNGFVQYDTEVTITGGEVGNNIFGGGKGLESFTDAGFVKGDTKVTVSGGSIGKDVYGGGELGYVTQDVEVNITGGTVTHDVYGGGALANTNIGNWNNSTDAWEDDTNKSALYKTHVSLTGGSARDVYGGALGNADRTPYVYGDILVELNGSVTVENGSTSINRIDTKKPGCVVERIFGANNLTGTPKGHVRVNVLATQTSGKANISKSNKNELHDGFEEENTTTTYDVKAVYGGGNLAAYIPADPENTEERSEVYIDGCDYVSIKQVYAGGNAASVPASYVRVDGTYEIEEVFGGDNGKDDYQSALDDK